MKNYHRTLCGPEWPIVLNLKLQERLKPMSNKKKEPKKNKEPEPLTPVLPIVVKPAVDVPIVFMATSCGYPG
jgi:hypothetical protein